MISFKYCTLRSQVLNKTEHQNFGSAKLLFIIFFKKKKKGNKTFQIIGENEDDSYPLQYLYSVVKMKNP